MAFGKHSKNIFCVCEIANLFHVKHEIFSLIFLLQVIFTSLLPSQWPSVTYNMISPLIRHNSEMAFVIRKIAHQWYSGFPVNTTGRTERKENITSQKYVSYEYANIAL